MHRFTIHAISILRTGCRSAPCDGHTARGSASGPHGIALYNVKDYGATGIKSDNALPAIQKAIDAAAVKGGTVYLPPGEYTSATIQLRSHVNLYLEAGATLYASERPTDFATQKVKSKEALLFGENLEDISIGGRGTIDGQGKYFWAVDTIERAFSHKKMVEKVGSLANAHLSRRLSPTAGLSPPVVVGTLQ